MNSIWDIINVPFGYVLRFCNKIVGNQYLFALLLFALIVEIVLLPFGIKQQKTSIKQAKLRPKEMAIRKKYAGRDDKPTQQKMQMEIQELYQKEGFNPMGGCLPLLIQFPILIALYNIVMNPLRYICGLSENTIRQLGMAVGHSGEQIVERNIDLLGQIKSMPYETFSNVEGYSEAIHTDLPNLTFIGDFFDLSITPAFKGSGLLLIWVPIVTFLAYFFSMKMNRKLSYQPAATDQATGCSNRMMDWMMPLFSVYIAFIVPAAIGVYWIFKSLLGVVKQAILKKAMPIPVCTEEEIKAAEKEMNMRVDKNTRVAKSGRVVRSLHHIDDEDFEDTAPAARARREALEAAEKEEAARKAAEAEQKKGVFNFAPVKKEEKPARKSKKEKAEKTKEPETKTNTDTNGEEK